MLRTDTDHPTLSMGARRLLKLLEHICSTSGECFAWQASLARQLESCERTVRRWLAELRDAGLVIVEKRHQNHIRLIEPSMHSATPAAAVESVVLIGQPPDILSGGCPEVVRRLSGRNSIKHVLALDAEAAEGAAAAAAIPPIPNPNPEPLVEDLVKRGVERTVAEGYLRCKDPGLLREAIDFFDEFRARKHTRNQQSAGPLLSMINNPGRWDLRQVEGVWQPPPDSTKHKRRRETDRLHRELQEIRRRRQQEAESRRNPPPPLNPKPASAAAESGGGVPRPRRREPPPGVDRVQWLQQQVEGI